MYMYCIVALCMRRGLSCNAACRHLDHTSHRACCGQVAQTQPTADVQALITTVTGVSLVFDPLIKQPQQVADAVHQAAQNLANGRR